MKLSDIGSCLAIRIASLLTALVPLASVQAQQSGNEGIQFDLPVLPQFQRYVDMLAYPSHLAVAMETNGLNPSHASRVLLLSAAKIEFRNLTVEFLGREGSAFSYEANIRLPGASSGPAMLSVPIVVDAASIARGKINVRLKPPLAGLIPEEIAGKIRFKAQFAADEEVQRKMIEYFDALAKKAPRERGLQGLLEQVMLDGYNRGSGPAVGGGREPGDAELVSDQLLLIATLAIWFVIVPAVLLVRRLRAKPRARS